jgi:hypothetical protein
MLSHAPIHLPIRTKPCEKRTFDLHHFNEAVALFKHAARVYPYDPTITDELRRLETMTDEQKAIEFPKN